MAKKAKKNAKKAKKTTSETAVKMTAATKKLLTTTIATAVGSVRARELTRKTRKERATVTIEYDPIGPGFRIVKWS